MDKPNKSGYRMPAEWETHAATLLHWPSNRETWPGERLSRAEKVYIEIIKALHRFEPVLLLIDETVNRKNVEEKLKSAGIHSSGVQIRSVPINDVWARDCGPIFIRKGGEAESKYAITDWEYNAWGGKYPPYHNDNNLPKWFADSFNLDRFSPGMVLEGGSIETNGDGIFLTTESVLLNKNRNPGMTKHQIEQMLNDYLGAEQIIWLKNGLAGDDTDGHIDDLARFLNRNTILTMIAENTNDINYHALRENHKILKQAKNFDGEPFEIVTLPLPKTKIEGTTVDGSEYVPASYANFYISNGAVLVPLYDEKFDDSALNLFRAYFPDREIIGIQCADLVWGQGSIHCITQQLYGLEIAGLGPR